MLCNVFKCNQAKYKHILTSCVKILFYSHISGHCSQIQKIIPFLRCFPSDLQYWSTCNFSFNKSSYSEGNLTPNFWYSILKYLNAPHHFLHLSYLRNGFKQKIFLENSINVILRFGYTLFYTHVLFTWMLLGKKYNIGGVIIVN